ncbi:hypothetical protein [Cellulomonas oligotrophica]|uniref:Uncharacterized protein n=1 Tax=Cellulomonas oligotrophica TaxID=931536 RepID=A0A7Y9JYB2_9CELL|nr:hypothetical protein [Cellulomonas oligotrophica]NYD86751.1 hypothetical protein [Cellulomonas oligotrophica]
MRGGAGGRERAALVGGGVVLLGAGFGLGTLGGTWWDVVGAVLRVAGLLLVLGVVVERWVRPASRDDEPLVTVRVTRVGPTPIQTLKALREHAPRGWFVPPAELVGALVPVYAADRATLDTRLARLDARIENIPPVPPTTP